MAGSATVICLYRVRSGSEEDFERLLERHWPALRRLGLATPDAPRHYRGSDSEGPLFVEIFDWADGDEGPRLAHDHPEVMAIWERMDKLCEARGGRPNMEFPHVRAIEVALA